MNRPTQYCISPQQTFAVATQDGLSENILFFSGVAILTFNKSIMDRLDELCGLKDTQWISSHHHPYSAARVVKRGHYLGLEIIALVPPMGASPLACLVEDLITCGVQAVFLVCAAWSLGPPVEFGDLIVPEFSLGLDGTSIHYGNNSGHAVGQLVVVEALAIAGRKRGAKVHVGGNATCEALYRITPQMVAGFRERGCLCMENGEASTLFAMSEQLGFLSGALFQPYIELLEGWNPDHIDKGYQDTCILQAQVALDASIRLKEMGLL
jgi:uridine phosphorylase